MITLTRSALVRMKPCDIESRLARFDSTDKKRLTIQEAFAAGFTVNDVLWIAGKLGLATDCARVAIFAAQQIAYLNTDSRVQAAIDAAQSCINAIGTDAARAAYAAASAARAARAAYAAASAARAARAADAARAAAYAADAAAYAAASAAARAARAAASAASAAAYAAASAAAYAADAAIRDYMIQLWGV